MSLPYICLQCRHGAATRGYQVRRAGFVSLGKLVDSEHHELAGPKVFSKNGGKYGPLPQAQSPNRRKDTEHDPQLESLFSSSIRRKDITFDQRAKKINSNVPPVHVVPARKLVDEHIQTLEHMLYVQRVPLVEMWKACHELLGSKTWQQMVSDAGRDDDIVFTAPQLNVFRDILLRVTHTRARFPQPVELPRVATAIRAYRKHNIMKYWWDQILWNLVSGYISLSPYYAGRTVAKDYSGLVLEEIIEVWRLLVKEYGDPARSSFEDTANNHGSSSLLASSSSVVGETSKWSREASKTVEADTQSSPPNISQRFSEYWPRHPGSCQQTNQMVVAAVVTFDCLNREQKEGSLKESVMVDSKILIRSLRPLVQWGRIGWDSAIECLMKSDIAQPTAERIVRRWSAIPIFLDPAPASVEKPYKPQPSLSVPGRIQAAPDAASTLGSALRNAKQQGDAAKITRVWHKFQASTGSGAIEETHRDELCSQFLSTFFAIRRQAEAVEVWNFMIQINQQPTLRHWHAMLTGCTAARDLTSMREIWKNMLDAGIEPNMKTWTIWIHGLMACGDWQSGMHALGALRKIWKPASPGANGATSPTKEVIEDQLTPSLDPIRAALTGLAHSNNLNLADTVLTWARTQNLPLDTQTYNITLRPAVRASNEPKIHSILQSMQAASCPPDIATFTIMLNGLLSNPSSPFHTKPHLEQQSAVFAILHEIERNGLKANTYTYSTILDGLLDPKILNVAAARAIMEHMTKNNIKPSPHIYTILTTHYFTLTPPDLTAIDSLLHRVKTEKTPLDPIFWDRMIEHYARVGETEKMLLVLRRMPQEGQSPGWMALLACLRVLVEQREWEAVRDLVGDVEDVRGVLRHGSGPWRGKDAFWELVGEVRREGWLGEEG